MQTQNIIEKIETVINSAVICVVSYPLDRFYVFGIFNLAKTTRPVSRHGGFLYHGN